jgi:hypothetical protein
MPPELVVHEAVSVKHARKRIELQAHLDLASFGLIDAEAGEEKMAPIELSYRGDQSPHCQPREVK